MPGHCRVVHSVDAKIETALVVMSEDERRQEARELIQAAFRERPELTETKLIEHDPGDDAPLHSTAPHSTPLHVTSQHNTSHQVISDPEESDISGVSENVEVDAGETGSL